MRPPDQPVPLAPILRCLAGRLPTIVEIFDAYMQRVGLPAIGTVERTDLRPGVYVVRFSRGKLVDEQAVALTGVPRVHVLSPGGELASPLPDISSGVTPENEAPWPRADVRAPGMLHVMLATEHDLSPAHVGAISFEHADGRRVGTIDFKNRLGSEGSPAFEWQGEAGDYQLVVRNGQAPMETVLPVPVSRGWCTQVFLVTRRYGEDHSADLPRARICLVPAGRLVAPGSPALVRQEALCNLLENLRSDVVEFGTDWRVDDAELPLAGLFAAHLMLRAAKPDFNVIWRLVVRLQRDLGWSADVRALASTIAARAGGEEGMAAGRALEALAPLTRPPLLLVACRSLREPDAAAQPDVIAPELREMLSEAGEVASIWFVRKRVAPDNQSFPALPSVMEIKAAALPLLSHLSRFAFDRARQAMAERYSAPYGPSALAGALRPEESSWDVSVEGVLRSLAQLGDSALDRLADKLGPLERQLAETIYPALNPLNRNLDHPDREREQAWKAVLAFAECWAQRRGISLQSERGEALIEELARMLASIARQAGAALKREPNTRPRR